MAFIRKVKTSSGATAVQIAYKAYGKIIRIDHIGSAHNLIYNFRFSLGVNWNNKYH